MSDDLESSCTNLNDYEPFEKIVLPPLQNTKRSENEEHDQNSLVMEGVKYLNDHDVI